MEPHHIIKIDEIELHLRIEAGERSNGNDRPAITMEERFTNLMEDGEKMRAVEALGARRPPAKIQKVIFLLRDHKHFVKYFEPRVASLGPIHHGKTKYKLGEKYKRRLAYEFVQRCGKSINRLYKEAEMEIKKLREYFEEQVTKKYDDEALAWILFVDGCAILEYIFCATNGDKFKKLNIKNDSVAFAHQDLFLLENQVPYRLLKLLMSLSGKENELKSSIASFIGNVTSQQTEPQQKQGESSVSQPQQEQGESSHSQPKPIEREPTHLLDLLRTTLLGSDPALSTKPNPPSEKATRLFRKQRVERTSTAASDCQQSLKPNPTTEKKTTRLSHPLPSSKSDPPSGKTRRVNVDWQSYRNVQELKASGIRLERSTTSCLRDISFKRGSKLLCFYPGHLRLPPIIVDDSTGPKFTNLIAYEMCLDFENNFGITSYISFLDSLIDEASDVKDLRKAHILHNFLGSDQEVAELFNEIGTDLVPNDEAYEDVKLQIQEYYDNDWMTWMAQVYHDHFSSPWTIIAFVGVLLILGLSITQTWFTIHPPGK